jgi:hypothetical protein
MGRAVGLIGPAALLAGCSTWQTIFEARGFFAASLPAGIV